MIAATALVEMFWELCNVPGINKVLVDCDIVFVGKGAFRIGTGAPLEPQTFVALANPTALRTISTRLASITLHALAVAVDAHGQIVGHRRSDRIVVRVIGGTIDIIH